MAKVRIDTIRFMTDVFFDGEFFSVDEWLSIGDFEDGNDPDNTWYNRSKGIKWELIEQ